MPNYRVQVVGQPFTTDVERDWITNVLHYAAPTTTPAALGAAVGAAYTANADLGASTWANLYVKVYDVSLPAHSPPVYQYSHPGTGLGALAPRQIALCLSFFSGLNIRGQRGRIYLGPWQMVKVSEFASTSVLTSCITMANALKHPGGADVIHQIWHPKTASWSNVSNYFVNNRWDTMRSRLPKETARQTA